MYILFFILWIVFNGRITLEITIFGIVISAAVYLFICKFMDYDPKTELMYIKKAPCFIEYLFVLIKEIVVANVAAIKLVLSPRQVIEPCIVEFNTELKSKLSRFLLANSITLTPGTITVSVEGNHFTVHCLDKSLSEGMEDSDFVRILRKIEK